MRRGSDTLPDAIKNHAVKLSVGTLLALGAAVWKAAAIVTSWERERVEAIEELRRDVQWLRRDVGAAVGKPVVRYFWED